ncbi:MAG: hypothetical protein ACI4K7_11225 [Oscillospiraceae bacterium]
MTMKSCRSNVRSLLMRTDTSESTRRSPNDVINASEIQSDSIAPKNVDCAYISIMTCIMNSVSEVIREEMLDTADKLMQWYE